MQRQLGSGGVAVLWCRLAAAALIQPLAWEFPYAAGVALRRKRKERKEGRKEGREERKKKRVGPNKERSTLLIGSPGSP